MMKNKYDEALDLDEIFNSSTDNQNESTTEDLDSNENDQDHVSNDEITGVADEKEVSEETVSEPKDKKKSFFKKKKEEEKKNLAKREEDMNKFKELDKNLYEGYSKEIYAPEKPIPGKIPESTYSKMLKLFASIAVLAAIALIAIYYI